MTAVFTPSLFDGPDLVAGRPGDVSWSGAHRTHLDERSWIDVVPGWLPGAEDWFARLVREVPWQQRRRRMFEQEIVEPRLTCGWALEEAPTPSDELGPALSQRYSEAFDRVSATRPSSTLTWTRTTAGVTLGRHGLWGLVSKSAYETP